MISRLRHRVTLLRPERTEDAGGGGAVGYVAAATVWAGVETGRASETDLADGLSSRISHRFHIRFREDVDVGWRVKWRGRTARILAARDVDGLRWGLVLDAEEERG